MIGWRVQSPESRVQSVAVRTNLSLVGMLKSAVVLAAIWTSVGFDLPVTLAAGEEFLMRGDDLVISVDTRWAGNTQGGYYPIRIRVVNRGASRNLTFLLSPQGEKLPAVERTVGAEQNATVQFTLSVPMVGEGSYGMLHVYEGGRRLEELSKQIRLPEVDHSLSGRPALLVISPSNVDCDRFEDAVNSTVSPAPSGGRVYRGGRYPYAPYFGGASRNSDHQIVPPTLLPDSWVDYSGLDIVAVPLQTLSGLPIQNRSAILHWVHCGGTLIVYNVTEPAGKSKELTRLLELDRLGAVSTGWQQADPKQRRFVTVVQLDGLGNPVVAPRAVTVLPGGVVRTRKGSGPAETKKPADGSREYVWSGKPDTFVRRQLMMGYVYAFRDNPFPGSAHDWDWFLRSLGSERYQWSARHGLSARQDNGEFLQFLIPGVKGVPVYAFVALITLFSVVIGPLNYFLLWKRKQLYLLVLTIPVIAFVTSLSLLGYSVIAHGFGTKSRVRSVTVLDQRSRTAVTTSRIALYAGLAPSRGLRFSPQTAVYTIWPTDQGFESGRVDWTESQTLQSGWLRSRTRTQFLVTSHRPERGRLEVGTPAGEKVSVSNGLEWDIEALIVADAGGTLYVGREIPAGAATRLPKATGDDLKRVAKMIRRHPLKVPDGVSDNYSLGIFDIRRSMRRWAYGNRRTTQFARSLTEQSIARFQMLGTSTGGLEKQTYLAILNENPGVELGIEGTDEQATLYLLLGYY